MITYNIQLRVLDVVDDQVCVKLCHIHESIARMKAKNQQQQQRRNLTGLSPCGNSRMSPSSSRLRASLRIATHKGGQSMLCVVVDMSELRAQQLTSNEAFSIEVQ